MAKIRIKIFRKENEVKFQVLQTNEKFRIKRGESYNSFKSKYGIEIISCYRPKIEAAGERVYLWGGVTIDDSFVASWNFVSEDLAVKFISNLKLALRDWAENWEGWI